MKLIISGFILIASFIQVFPQKIVTTYYNPYWFLTTKEFAEFTRTGVIDTIDYKFHGIVKDYFKNGNLAMIGTYEANIKQGEFLFYYQRGNLKTRGFYKDNLRWGIWTNYYENGNIKEKIVFNDIFLSVLEYFDENGNPKLLKGTGDWETDYFNDFGMSNVRITGSFKDSLRNGTWKYYTDYLAREENEYEKLPLTEVYENGKFKGGEYYDHDGKKQETFISTVHVLPETTKFENTEKWKASIYASKDEYPYLKFLPEVDSSFFPVNSLASFPGGTDSLRSKIASRIKLKKSYIRSQQQRFCMFRIVIDEKGILEIEEDPNVPAIKFYPGESIFYKQVLSAITNLPVWNPAIRNRKNVKSHYMIYIIMDGGLINVRVSGINQIITDQDFKLIS